MESHTVRPLVSTCFHSARVQPHACHGTCRCSSPFYGHIIFPSGVLPHYVYPPFDFVHDFAFNSRDSLEFSPVSLRGAKVSLPTIQNWVISKWISNFNICAQGVVINHNLGTAEYVSGELSWGRFHWSWATEGKKAIGQAAGPPCVPTAGAAAPIGESSGGGGQGRDQHLLAGAVSLPPTLCLLPPATFWSPGKKPWLGRQRPQPQLLLYVSVYFHPAMCRACRQPLFAEAK